MATNRIREWRKRKVWSMQQLAVACGTSRAQIDKLERGERRLTVDWMVRLAKPLGCRPAELLPDSMVLDNNSRFRGSGGFYDDSADPDSLEADADQVAGMCEPGAGGVADSSQSFALSSLPLSVLVDASRRLGGGMIPVRSAARGGAEQEMFLEDGPIDYRPCPSFVAHVRDAYAIYVVGDSMIPMYRPGQILYVNPHKPLLAGRGVVVTKLNKAVLIKELVRETSEKLILREYRPEMREFMLLRSEVAEAHCVVGAEEPGN